MRGRRDPTASHSLHDSFWSPPETDSRHLRASAPWARELAWRQAGTVKRQPNSKRRAPRLRVDRERSVVSGDDDPSRRVQREPDTLPDTAGREERVKHAAADLLGDAGAVVGDVDLDAAVGQARQDRDRAAGGCQQRVFDQLGPDLVELSAGNEDPRQLWLVFALDRDPRCARL